MFLKPFFDEFQKTLGKHTAQVLLLVLGALFVVAGFQIQVDRHTARMILLCIAAICLLLLAIGLWFSYRSSKSKVAAVIHPPSIYSASAINSSLSESEREILDACKDKGEVWILGYSGGGSWVRAGVKDFRDGNDRAFQARYMEAFGILFNQRGYFRRAGQDYFCLTGTGFEKARQARAT
jgi:hypothetical protein